jgi:hypothetical protein
VITWQRLSKDENGDAVKNLKVWSVEAQAREGGVGENAVVGRFVQKSQNSWNLQYTSDEHYCARVVTNEVQFYKSHDLSNVWNKLRVEGVADFALSPGKSQAIAVFVPERKVSLNNSQPGVTCILTECRDNRLQSRFSWFRSLTTRSHRRPSSRATKSNSNGTTLAPLSSSWRKPTLTGLARVIMERRPFTC